MGNNILYFLLFALTQKKETKKSQDFMKFTKNGLLNLKQKELAT